MIRLASASMALSETRSAHEGRDEGERARGERGMRQSSGAAVARRRVLLSLSFFAADSFFFPPPRSFPRTLLPSLKQRFAAVIMRIRDPKTTALIFASGKMVSKREREKQMPLVSFAGHFFFFLFFFSTAAPCPPLNLETPSPHFSPTTRNHDQVCTGAKSEDAARLACRKYAKIVQKLGFPASFKDFKVQNIVGSADVRFPIRLEGLAYAHGYFCSYEPELFPGLIYRMRSPKVVLLIFVSGKVVLTGAKAREDVYAAFDAIYPVLQEFRKADAAPHPAITAAAAAANAGAAANGGSSVLADVAVGGMRKFLPSSLRTAPRAAAGTSCPAMHHAVDKTRCPRRCQAACQAGT